MNTYDHAHGFVRTKHTSTLAMLALAICFRLHLPTRWAIESGELPHDPECTPTVAVLRPDGLE